MQKTENPRPSRTRIKLAVAGMMGMLIVLLVVSLINLQEIADFLIIPETIVKAEIAVVLSGGNIPRVLAARDLYKNGLVKNILLIPEPIGSSAADTELRRLGINLLKENDLTKRILEASKVPSSDVLVLAHSIDGTIKEAEAIKEFLEKHQDVERIVIVTSKLSSQRQCYIFKKILIDVEVQCTASAYDTSNMKDWWKHPRRALQVLIEYLKFTANFLTLLV